MRKSNNTYIAMHSEKKQLLACFDILPGDFDMIAQFVNERSKPVHHVEVAKPEHEPVVARKKPGTKVKKRQNKKGYMVDGHAMTEEEFAAYQATGKSTGKKRDGIPGAEATAPDDEVVKADQNKYADGKLSEEK